MFSFKNTSHCRRTIIALARNPFKRHINYTTNVKPGYTFSGIQPTGVLHIGNYLGAIRNWKKMQSKPNIYGKTIYCIVDLHSITVPQNPENLRNSIFNLACTLLACGLDPNACSLYVQGHVTAHVELSWIFGCITPTNWCEKMIQYKEKREKGLGSSTGLFTYPILQAADILLYGGNKVNVFVPIGEDQRQHLEFARDVAKAFNHRFGEYFGMPIPVYENSAARVMSLSDGTCKMSKSDANEKSRIHLIDTDDEIRLKIKKAKTDSISGIYYDKQNRPEISNLIEIYAAFEDMEKEKVEELFKDTTKSSIFKEHLAEVIIKHISPIREEILRLQKDRDYVNKILQKGKEEVEVIAMQTLNDVKHLVGLK